MNNTCRVCTTEIKQMCRKNTGICGEICEKIERKRKVDPTFEPNFNTYIDELVKERINV